MLLTTDPQTQNGSLAYEVSRVEEALRFFCAYRDSELQREQQQEHLQPPVNGRPTYKNMPDGYGFYYSDDDDTPAKSPYKKK